MDSLRHKPLHIKGVSPQKKAAITAAISPISMVGLAVLGFRYKTKEVPINASNRRKVFENVKTDPLLRKMGSYGYNRRAQVYENHRPGSIR